MQTKERLTYKGAVLTSECDSNNHMNVMYYVNKFELAGRNMSLELGMSKSYLEKNKLGIAVLEQNIKYRSEVFEDDLLYIKSKVISFKEKVFTVLHIMYEAESGKIAAEMLATLIMFDLEKRKGVSLPPMFIENLEAYLVTE